MMDPRSFDEIGMAALADIGAEIFGHPVPSTLAWSQIWQAQGKGWPNWTTGQGPGIRDQVSGYGGYETYEDTYNPYADGQHGPWTTSFGGPLIPTPDEIRTREALVDGKFKTLDADMHQNAPATESGSLFVQNWTDFKKSWDTFFVSHQTAASMIAPLGPGLGTVDRQVTAFENQLAGWRNALVQIAPAGASIQTPPVQSTQNTVIAPSAGTVPPSTASLPWWAISLLSLGAVGLVGYLGYRLYSAVSPTAFVMRHAVGGRHTHSASDPDETSYDDERDVESSYDYGYDF